LRVHKTIVINCVGLTPRLISPRHTPRIEAFVRAGRLASVGAVIPAVTCSVQSTYLTGQMPGGAGGHGIVGNGWYFRDECEIKFWRQSNKLVRGPKIWDIARRRDASKQFTCANICWWYAMYSSADYTVTPRPMYPADGRKLPDIWTEPPELRQTLQAGLGRFPLFQFWGPATSIRSTEWIAHAAMRVYDKLDPTLTLIYLPHLDYGLQKYGTEESHIERDLRELDRVVGELVAFFQEVDDPRIILLSEYGIVPVSRPVHLNRVLREHQMITFRTELGREMLDPGASAAFAVADHQVAHVYVNDPARIERVAGILEKVPGVARVLREPDKREAGLDHDRAGELICLAEPDAWFTYYYWLDDARAPDFARTVDIHRKPGYDPVELFLDPKLAAPKLKIAATLAKRKLGLRAMMDVIGLDASLVKGSHGLAPRDPADGAMIASNAAELLPHEHIAATDVFNLILRHLELN
jgi:predicted AlkP superfamily pyrophosphatase or phosphodiesterase